MSIYGNPVMLGGSGGGSTNVLSGTTAPTAAQGSNGAVYLKYGGKVLLQSLVSSQSELTVAVTASTSWSGFEPWKAFTSTTGWIGAGGDPHWLQVEFPSAVELEELDFQSLDGRRSHAISRIGYSDDGATFTDLVLAASTMVSNVGHADISNPVSAKYYRLYFDGSYGLSYYPMVSSLEMYTIGGTLVQGTYAKVNGVWQPLIGTDINDIDLGGGGGESDYYNEHLFSDMPYTAWVENGSVCSVTVDSALKKVSFGYTSGVYIGQRFGWQGIFYPGAAASLHYKITTGATSYDQSLRFAPGIGILPYTLLASAVINHGEYGAVTNVGSFLKYAYTTQRNDTVEGSFDLRDISTPYILIVFGAGWNAEFSEITFA